MDFSVDENGIMKFQNRVCVSDFPELKKRILEEGHRRNLSIHLGTTKLYQDLKKNVLMGRYEEGCSRVGVFLFDLSEVEDRALKVVRLMQPLSILKWKWENISIDFVVGFPKTMRGSDSIWVIVV